MTDINIGSIVKTSYGTGPYEVIGIETGCTCPHYWDECELGSDEAEELYPSPPHIHLVVNDPGCKLQKHSYLGGYALQSDGRWLNVMRPHVNLDMYVDGNPDELFVLGHRPWSQPDLVLDII